MISRSTTDGGFLTSLVRMRSTNKSRRTIIFGLSSEICSREILLRFLVLVAIPGDNVIAVHHLLEPPPPADDSFNPNSFHIHEDICKSKQVEFQLKVCTGGGHHSYITQLTHQVRIHFATILAVGCRSPWPNDSCVAMFLKSLPPTCSLLVIDSAGKVVLQRQGTCQDGSATTRVLVSSGSTQPGGTSHQMQKSLTMPSPAKSDILKLKKTTRQQHDSVTLKSFQRLAILETKGSGRRFTPEEISLATNEFSPEMVIGKGGNSTVYQAKLDDGQLAAVKVLNDKDSSEDLLREVETLSCVSHDNIVQLIGYCYSKGMHAIVYGLLKENLKQKLKNSRWRERMKVAIGVGKALEYLHSLSPPIIHRDVKSSNILLSDHSQPKLSDFGAAIMQQQHIPGQPKPFRVVGTFGYLAPEYMMYGKIDEKIDVYSYGVVLLELITGKEAIQATNQGSNHESLVLWARSLLSCGLSERLVDPYLNEDYNKDEMRTMIIAARLCLMHSSSRRPSMKNIVQIFEQPEQWLEMQRKREELLSVQTGQQRS